MCFLLGATGSGVTSTGEALIGGVSDDPYLFRTFVRVVQMPKNTKCFAHLGTELRYVDGGEKPPPFDVEVGQPSRGVNAAGLSFTCALVMDVPQSAPSTVSFAELSHRMMNKCSVVKEAIHLFQAAGAISPAFSVLLADASGDLAHVEVGSYGCFVLQRYSRKEPGIVIAVNCYQCPNLIPYNQPEAQLMEERNNNGVRLSRGWELAKRHRGNIDVDVIRMILSDHQNRGLDCGNNSLIKWWGYSICNHGTNKAEYNETEPSWGTVSAEIMQPSHCALYYCYGWPCGEQPAFKDQVYQNGSWGCFLPFTVTPKMLISEKQAVIECTTIDGIITNAGKVFKLALKGEAY
jgi:hypothetical protein